MANPTFKPARGSATITLADGKPRDLWFNMRTAAHLAKHGVDLIEVGKKMSEDLPKDERQAPGLDFFFYVVLEGLRTNPKYRGMTEEILGDLLSLKEIDTVIDPVMKAMNEFMGADLAKAEKGGAEGNVEVKVEPEEVQIVGTSDGSSEPPPAPVSAQASSGT